VKVQVQYVEAHVAGAHLAEQRVEISAVVVEQASAAVYHLRYLQYLFLEQSERVRVGHHYPGYGVVEQCGKLVGVDCTVSLRLHHYDLQTAYRRARRVGAVRAVGDNHAGALKVAALQVVLAHYHQPGKLAVRPGERIEGELRHPGDCRESLAEVVVELQRPLRRLLRL